MAGKPAQPFPSDQRSDAPEERLGPIAIARHVKDDGRALILYSEAPRAEQEPRQQGQAAL
jgi:hypothetical protein